MKEMVEEYGLTVIAIIGILILVNVVSKLKNMYLVSGEVFLNSIGG